MSNYINGLSIEHFRLNSLRRKKRWQRSAFDKKLRKLHKEERAISKKLRHLGYEKLEPPIQRGWKRSFVLRDDVARSKEARFFQGILDKINTVEYSWKKDFKVKRRHRGKKIYVVSEQKLQEPWPCSFRKKKFTETEQSYFDWVITNERMGKGFLWVFRFREPWRFKLKIEPNIIRHAKIKDFDLERRKDEINAYFERNHLTPKMFKVVYGRYQWRLRHYYEGILPKYEYDPFKNRSFADILEEYQPKNESFPRNPRMPGVSFCLPVHSNIAHPVRFSKC